MTLLETRQLGIEFERRLQALDSTFEVQRKLDTETIYAYLNEAQRQLFTQLYGQMINTPSGVEQAKYLSSTLKNFVDTANLSAAETMPSGNRDKYFNLPLDFFAYIRSNTTLTTAYNFGDKKNIDQNKIKRVQNLFLRHEDFSRYVNEYFDEGIILRRPVAVLDNDKLHLIWDTYTTLAESNPLALYYYRYPKDMDLFTNQACEMPYICFEQLVELAVQLYLTYAKGQLDAEREQARKQQEKRNKKQDEE